MVLGNVFGGFEDRAIDFIKTPSAETVNKCMERVHAYASKKEFSEEETTELVGIVTGDW